MESITHLILFAGLCSLSLCDPKHQYLMFDTPKTWSEAQSFCREKCLDLTTINNMTEMDAVLQAVAGKYDDAVWFGIRTGTRWKSHWSIVDKDFYSGARQTPLNWGIKPTHNCGFYRNGGLYSGSCHKDLNSICFDAKKEGADQYIVTEAMNWTEARDYCRTNHTDLTSVRNAAEHQIVKGLANGSPMWVGVFLDGWEWSDKSSSSMRYWLQHLTVWEGETGICGALMKDNGRWGRLPCSEEHPFLCTCKTKLNFIKVKLNLQDTVTDPNDPSVQDKILEQMMQKLNKSGAGDLKLQWKKQPDGRVFVPAAP